MSIFKYIPRTQEGGIIISGINVPQAGLMAEQQIPQLEPHVGSLLRREEVEEEMPMQGSSDIKLGAIKVVSMEPGQSPDAGYEEANKQAQSVQNTQHETMVDTQGQTRAQQDGSTGHGQDVAAQPDPQVQPPAQPGSSPDQANPEHSGSETQSQVQPNAQGQDEASDADQPSEASEGEDQATGMPAQGRVPLRREGGE